MSLDGPLGAFTDSVITKMLEAERAEGAYIRGLGGRCEELIGAVCAIHPGLPHPAFNFAHLLDAEGHDPTVFFHRAELAYARERLPFGFLVTPISRPADLARLLGERGYAAASPQTWMELMLPPPSSPPDLRISVSPTDDRGVWARAVALGLESPASEPLLFDLAKASARSRTHVLLLARYAGVPAGGCEVSVEDGIGVVRRLAVLRAHRAREVTRALLHSACESAFALDAFRLLTRVFHGTGAEALLESFGFAGMQITDAWVRRYPAFLLD